MATTRTQRLSARCRRITVAILSTILLYQFIGRPALKSDRYQLPQLVAVPPAAGTPAAIAALKWCGRVYSDCLSTHPLPAKSVTAGLIFCGADAAAQKIQAGKGKQDLDKRRLVASSFVGVAIFGPSAHHWFSYCLRLLPGNGLLSLLGKTALGQVFFGPYITTVFFAAALWGSGSLTWKALSKKVKADLLPTVIAGLGFWPLMDFIAFACLSEHYIPPFLNVCSFVWTVFLSLQAAKRRPLS
eukprot:TRINITY_DN13895_c0_g6_i1.p1 TRINITY_DN13895_c0_g6~~TRINITY_DN13895_c0_g6_i1.p1  ORF type:complete len:268 (-),score=27.94 TRINITY_DN13895_c0_g6_i1:65-793(-)